MRNQGLGSWPQRRARMTPDRVAIRSEEGTWTYADLAERTARCAQVLGELGVRRGDRVAYLGPNHHTFFDFLFGASAIGAILVPINARLTSPEVDHVLSDSGAVALGVAASHAEFVDAASSRIDPSRILGIESTDYEDRLASVDPEWIDQPVGLDDVAVIMYTSGTTGRPKGAMLTHGNLTWNAFNVLIDLDMAHDEVSLVCAPLFHIAALSMMSLPTLVKGGTVRLQGSFDPAVALEVIEQEGITQMFGVPTMFNSMAASPRWDSTDLTGLRSVMCGGAPVPKAIIETYLRRDVVFLQGYGMTETAPGVLFLDGPSAVEKAGTAGVPSFFTDVRLVDSAMNDVGSGERGEVVVAGPNVMKGYWGRPAETAASFDGAWFHTGDVATSDADGYYTIVDRVKDVIISGGENIYPAEVEDALLYHPAVAECAVIGVPDDHWGEVGCAVVVLREPVADTELLDFVAGRLARYKVPKTVVIVDQLPKSGVGKVLKQVLRRRLAPDE